MKTTQYLAALALLISTAFANCGIANGLPTEDFDLCPKDVRISLALVLTITNDCSV